ncbi:ubiquitin-associated domain-containing protein 1 [Amyelois transitella]|uniref:ubiquitin-associated domain-containing protein 1 n=1 Tax=Amyelois transitella TaxID=680683 RepID=UPI00299061E5|nr:ubiquitin-associated domain-containing protein 1 [Amyelois transitella]
MLLSDTFNSSELLIKVISPEGLTFSAYFAEDTLLEEVKNRAIDFFYPNGETGSGRFKIVRVYDMSTLHDFLTLSQEQVTMQEELLLVERRIPEASTLWDLGSVRAPLHGAIAAATASLPAPQNTMRQPNLQSLLSTNELSYELRKILISLIEAGARLAAAGRNYEMSLAQLSAALDEPRRLNQTVIQVITPEEIAARFHANEDTGSEAASSIRSDGHDSYKRAEHLQRFLEKFRAWRIKIAESPTPEAISALKDLGFTFEEAEKALRSTGCNVPAAASYLVGERGSSVFELINGLPDGPILQTLLKQPQIQRGLLNTRMLIAFIAMVGQTGSASLWLNSPHGSPLLSQISRTYHSEKYCLAVNQFSNIIEETSQQSAKVPNMFWSGGDVIHDNGFGCYAQKGRLAPIGADNFHFSHSMPGLVSMRVTADDEMCGIFNITFKPMPQFDLKNVVIGRVIRPCSLFSSLRSLGAPLCPAPLVQISAARLRGQR